VTFSLDEFRLDDRVAVVTGAARGLGAALATGLAACGARVAICDRNDLSATAAACGDALVNSVVLDVRRGEAVADWIAGLDRVDILVNNAGGTFHADFMDVSENAQRSLMDVNFGSVTTMVRACVPKMPSGGSIVNITSVEAYKGSPGFAVYGAMKAAVEHLSRSLALELSARGIRVNTIAPDALRTTGDEELMVGTDDYGAKLALGWGQPDDMVGAAVFLASSASRFITGSTIHVDGGSDAARGWRKTPEGWWP
jgi:NAD(P)-dependent dehydrogenase (short-subunit alcohol dehydrogenase family)